MTSSKPVLWVLRLPLQPAFVSLSSFISGGCSHVWLDGDPAILLSLIHQSLVLLLNLVGHRRDDGIVRLGSRE